MLGSFLLSHSSLLYYACILVPHTWDRLIKAAKMFGRVWREGRGILSVASFPGRMSWERGCTVCDSMLQCNYCSPFGPPHSCPLRMMLQLALRSLGMRRMERRVGKDGGERGTMKERGERCEEG